MSRRHDVNAEVGDIETSGFNSLRGDDTEDNNTDKDQSNVISSSIDEPDSGLGKEKGPEIVYASSSSQVEGVLEEEQEVWRDDADYTITDNSPYPEVRAAVPTGDDPSIRVNHWRTWVLTTIFVIVFAGVNQFFSLRYPTMTIGFIVAQLLSYPFGSALAKLPNKKLFGGKGWLSWFDLNPGPFSMKEHATLTIAVSLTSSSAYAMNLLIAQTNFYNLDLGVGYEILLVITSQMLGYGLAGLSRRFVVYPSAMIWPETLISTTLFTTIHGDKARTNINGWKISRYSFFFVVLAASFIFYWFPGFIFTALSYFTWICWIAPNNVIVNQLFGYNSGLGIIPITFDWTQITQAMSYPLGTPYWVVANSFASVVLFFWIIVPILYYTNTWYAKYLPMLSATTFDNTAKKYNVSKVLDKKMVLNEEAYHKYSPLYVPFSYLMSYALNFAAVTSLFVHCYFYHGKEIWNKIKDSRHGGEDYHKKLMSSYKEVPDYWYAILFFICLGISLAIPGIWDMQLPVWGMLIAIIISIVNFIPQGLLEGISNQHVGLNIITELVAGYIWPGKPLANILVKLYGFIPMRQGLDFSRDLKLGQYMKVPPRILFWVQIYCTLLASLVNVGVQRWMRFNVDDVCSSTQKDGFICASGRTVFNASIIWGAVGPGRLFSPGRKYNAIMYFFLIGAICPVITYYLHKKWPRKWFGKLNAPIFFNSSGNIPPATGVNYGALFIVVFTFNYYIKNKWNKWWLKYNYVLSAGIESGVAIATVLIFLCVTYPGGELTWWGNTVWKKTDDYNSVKYRTLAKGETFGPTTWD